MSSIVTHCQYYEWYHLLPDVNKFRVFELVAGGIKNARNVASRISAKQWFVYCRNLTNYGGTRGVGAEACNAIAKALRIPPETVFRRAGLLPDEPDTEPPSFMDWIRLWLNANEVERDHLLELAEKLAKENEEKGEEN